LSPAGIRRLEDLAGRRIAVAGGTTNERMLAAAPESFIFRECERLWRADGDLPLPWYSDALESTSEYDA
jgi:hypothetical protein